MNKFILSSMVIFCAITCAYANEPLLRAETHDEALAQEKLQRRQLKRELSTVQDDTFAKEQLEEQLHQVEAEISDLEKGTSK